MQVYDPNQAMNAFAVGQQLGTGMRERKTMNAFSQKLGEKDYGGAEQYALSRGSPDLAQYASGKQSEMQGANDQARLQKAYQLKSLTENMLTIPEAQRGDFLMSHWQQIEPIVESDFMTFWQASGGDVSDASLNEDIAMFRAQLGEAPPAPQAAPEPIKVDGRLIDPNTYETLYEPPAEGPVPMSAYQAAQIANQRAQLQFNRDKHTASQGQGRDEWSALAMGDGNAILYNQQTGESRQFGGQPEQGQPPMSGQSTFEGFASPFEGEAFRSYRGGEAEFMPANYVDGFSPGDAGGKFGEAGPGLVTGGQGFPTNRKPTEYDKVRDREMAKDLSEWTLGGQAQAASQLRRLKDVITTLESGANVSGPMVGNLPLKSITAPQAKDTQDTVGSVVQQSLKAILGGQFAEREAEELLKRAYDPGMDEALNAKRLKVLYDELVYRAKMNDYAARYSDQYGTLEGFDGYLPQIGDFFSTERAPNNPFETAISAGQKLRSPTEMSDDELLNGLGLN